MPLKLINGRMVDTDTMEEPVFDNIPDEPADTSGDLTCEACGGRNDEWWPGKRGRKPRFHAACRPNAGSAKTGTRTSSTLPREDAIRESLASRYITIGRLLSMLHPAYGAGVRENMERAIEADIAAAKASPRFRKYLLQGLEKTAMAEVVAVHGQMFAPIVIGTVAQRGRQAGKAKPSDARGRGGGNPSAPPQSGPTYPASPPPRPEPYVSPVTEHVSTDNVHPLFDDPMMPADPPMLDEPSNAAAMDGMPG